MGYGRIATGILALLTACLLFAGAPANADEFTVPDDGYHSTDTIGALELWNEYHVSAGSDEEVKYSFQVEGSGKISVFFVQGSSFSMSSSYYVLYSAEDPVTHYSNTFPVDSSDGSAFTIIVMSEELSEVTYSADITVEKTPATTYIFGVLILVAIVVIIVVVRRMLRRGKKPAQAPPMAPMQPQVAPPQQPPAPPQNPPAP